MSPCRLQHLQSVARLRRQKGALGRPLEDLRCRVGLQQPALQAIEVHTHRARPEHLFQLGLVDQDAQAGIELVAQRGQLRENAEADFQGADDRAVRVVIGAQRGDGAIADAVPANVQAGGHPAMVQRLVEQQTVIGHRIAEGLGVLHAQQGDAGLAPIDVQLQGLVALQRLPGGCQLAGQARADTLQLLAIPRRPPTQDPVRQAHQAQHVGIGRQHRGIQPTLLQQALLRTLHSQRLQLALILILQLQDRLAGLIVVECQPAEQQGQHQAAHAQQQAWPSSTGSTVRRESGHGTGGQVVTATTGKVVAKC